VAKSIFVTDNDDALARRYAHTSEGPYHFYFKQLIRKLVGFGGRSNLFKLDQSEPDDAINADTMTPRLVLAGSVNSVVDQLLATQPGVGALVLECTDLSHFAPELHRRLGLPVFDLTSLTRMVAEAVQRTRA
jgi:hypothetical protein